MIFDYHHCASPIPCQPQERKQLLRGHSVGPLCRVIGLLVCGSRMDPSLEARGQRLRFQFALFPRFLCQVQYILSSPPEHTHVNFYVTLDRGSAHLKYSRTRGLLYRSLYRRHISMRLVLTNSPLKAFLSLRLRNTKSPQTHFNPV
jgi:hypothetical protein